jgi:cyclopropane-fatty-acyl-phospholipid synthase
MAHPPAAWPLLLALTLAGAAAWTLVEYLMHRWLLHRLEPFRSWHGMHHQRPLALLGTPTAVSVTLILLLVYAPVRAVLGHADAAALTLGFIAGYFAYAVLHHAVHHWRAQWDWLRGLKRWHARHHHLDGTRCFGVSSAFWDKMLGSGIEQTPGRATRPRPRG